jgi:hypothetical protein
MLVNSPILLAAAAAPNLVRWAVITGLVGLTIALLVLMASRWGQANPLRKCIVLSVLAHLLLAIYATTVYVVSGSGVGGGEGQGVEVAWLGVQTGDTTILPRQPDPKAWQPPEDPMSSETVDLLGPVGSEPQAETTAPPQREQANMADTVAPPQLTAVLPSPAQSITEEARSESNSLATTPSLVEAVNEDIPPPASNEPNVAELPPAKPTLNPMPPRQESLLAPRNLAEVVPGRPNTPRHSIPPVLQYRVVKDRLQIALGNGGSVDSERAVENALKWFAEVQSDDGSWDTRRFEGGHDIPSVATEHRGATSRAESGITGLVLLSFLASGNTHERGDYQPIVQRGLEYLLSHQARDGNLAGNASELERLYCHGMATLALCEAYAMSGDDRMRSAIERAMNFTLLGQSPDTGGWRYMPGVGGDTSQLGWQVMSMKSAELAGFSVPSTAREGAARFLRSVAQGPNSGWACYRPNSAPSRTMTAEALVCRQVLEMEHSREATRSAIDFIMNEIPGHGPMNVYYYYYGTMATYQMQGSAWRRWNEALQDILLHTQRVNGPKAGSWDPDPVYGPYAGRAYTTALATLCLEVYYRYTPTQIESAARAHRRN